MIYKHPRATVSMWVTFLLLDVVCSDVILQCRLQTCVLLSTFVAIIVPTTQAVNPSRAVTLKTTIDGLSVPGIFFTKLDALSKERKSFGFRDVAEGPCFQGGDDCSDYDTSYDPCNKFTCGFTFSPHTSTMNY
jgi:hypothetical protein